MVDYVVNEDLSVSINGLTVSKDDFLFVYERFVDAFNKTQIDELNNGKKDLPVFEVLLTQSYARTFKVNAEDGFEANELVDGMMVMFSESDYVSLSSSTEIV